MCAAARAVAGTLAVQHPIPSAGPGRPAALALARPHLGSTCVGLRSTLRAYSRRPTMAPLRFSRWRPHPWHGLDTGPDPPTLVNAYIEITPLDGVKYEVDKASGYLHVDRPQLT